MTGFVPALPKATIVELGRNAQQHSSESAEQEPEYEQSRRRCRDFTHTVPTVAPTLDCQGQLLQAGSAKQPAIVLDDTFSTKEFLTAGAAGRRLPIGVAHTAPSV